nr:PAS domain S-box protein [Cytophagales bacterium]
MKENYPLLVSEIKKMLGTFPANEELLALLERMDQPAPDNEGEAPPVRLRRQLRDSEARYQRIIECTTDLIYECDAQGYFTYANPVACSTFGYSLEEMQKMHFLDAAAPEHRDMVRRFYKQQFDERIPDTYLEFMNLTRDGRNVWVGHNVHLQQDNNRDWVLGFHGVARDITKAKATEQALIDARRTAEDSAKAKEHFLSVMSHEMRTPLNAVIGLSHLLLEENPLANQVEHLQAIKHSADSLMMIINEVLDFSKIESGKVIFENTTFSLDELLKGVEQSLGYKARNAGLELLVQLDPNLPAKITGDPLRLTQILLNLAGNAVKFTEKGCVQIGVQQISRNTETITIEFKVSDTGIGIPKLGLAITKQLVERQGGLIHVQSKMGRGSTFTVLLTFGLNSALESAASPPAAQPIPSLALRGAHILLVEDNRMNQLVVKKFLEKWGMRLQIAENGIE